MIRCLFLQNVAFPFLAPLGVGLIVLKLCPKVNSQLVFQHPHKFLLDKEKITIYNKNVK